MPKSVTRSHQTERFLKTEDKTEYWIKQQPKVAAVETWQFWGKKRRPHFFSTGPNPLPYKI